MNTSVTVTMLGTPSIQQNGTILSFPYRQAEAVLYYLFYNKSANKNILADLIWEKQGSEDKINSNLRNAFYIIRKSLGKDFLLRKPGNIITINPAYSITIDIELFEHNKNDLSFYKGEFLNGFYLKNNISFNEWISDIRQYYKRLYLKALQQAIEFHYQHNNFEICESLCLTQIQINEFDETAYKYLMQIYSNRKEYAQALKIYNQLETLLEEELFEMPAKELGILASEIEVKWNQHINLILEEKKGLKSSTKAFFYGRKKEIELIQQHFHSILNGTPTKHLLICGEAGIGKTRLADYSIESFRPKEQLLFFSTRCFYAEEQYILKPWQKIIRELLLFLKKNRLTSLYSSFVNSIYILFPFSREEISVLPDSDDLTSLDYKSVQSVFVHSLIHFSKSYPMILYFDDIQWADELTLSLIRDLCTSLYSCSSQKILLLFTMRNNVNSSCNALIEDFDCFKQLTTLNLKRFNLDDTVKMAATLLPDYVFSEDLKQQLFKETEGNSLFITEALNTIKYNNGSPSDLTPNMRNIIQQRITPIAPEYRRILDLISIFFDGVSYHCLHSLSKKDDYELMEILEELLKQGLLKEYHDCENTFFTFTHQKILEYVYDEMSWTKKRILHHKAALYYETLLRSDTKDMQFYPKLIYHFEKSADQTKYLKYTLKYLYQYLNVTHEFFPVIENNITLFSLDMRIETRERLPEDLSAMEKLLFTVEAKLKDLSWDFSSSKNEITSEEQLEVLSDYLHMIGRHYIRICQYKKGLNYIEQLKQLNLKHSSSLQTKNLIQANRQLICIYVNRYEPEKMLQVISESFKLLNALPGHHRAEYAIWKRLQGLADIMMGNLSDATKHLEESIDLFLASSNYKQHLSNLAAAYSWLGEVYRFSEEYEKAFSYYEKAIELGNQNFLTSGTAVFYAYAGMAAFDCCKYEKAEKYLLQSIKQYESNNLMWGRSLPYAYYAQMQLQSQDWNGAFESLNQALTFAQKLENPYECAIIYRIFAQIKSNYYPMEHNTKLLEKFLPESFSFYYKKATELLTTIYSPIEKKFLEQLLK